MRPLLRQTAPTLLIAALLGALPARSRAACPNDFPRFVRTPTPLRATADTRAQALMTLPVGVRVRIDETRARSCRVTTEDDKDGWLSCADLSTDWLEVRKADRRLVWHRGDEARSYPIHLGYNPVDDKERVGSQTHPEHWRTPEGAFYVCRKVPVSTYYKALLISYPNREDARRGLAQGLIDPATAKAIERAIERRVCPPMNTVLGGLIEIHGNDQPSADDWTWGCVAATDATMDLLYPEVQPGTPVIICP